MSFVFGACSNEIQLFISTGNVDFAGAETTCASIEGGQLAIPRNLESFERMTSFALENGGRSFVGLVDTDGNTDLAASRFTRLDGDSNPFTAEVEVGELPWNNNEPNDTSGIEDCVEIVTAGRLNDIRCNIDNRKALCERPCITACIDGVELSMNTDTLSFEEAQDACLAKGGQLAIPRHTDNLTDITEFVEQFVTDSVFIGLVDESNVTAIAADTLRFLGVDGAPNGFTNRDPTGVLSPWATGTPGIENCVALDPTTGEITDASCSTPLASVCESYCGTSPTFVFDECTDDLQLYLNKDLKTTDEAFADCKSIDPKGRLAVPSNQTRLDLFANFSIRNDQTDNVILGLRNFVEAFEVTEAFLTMEGEENPFTSGTAGVLPWEALGTQPNNGIGDQKCVNFKPDEVNINDRECYITLASMCERPCVATVDSPVVFDECVDGTQFFFNPELKSFDEASLSCQSLDDTAKLAVPDNSQRFTRLQTFLNDQTVNGLGAYVGLRNFDLNSAVTESFLTTDLAFNPFTAGNASEFPWGDNEPNNFNNDNEFCAQLLFTNNTLIDVNCDTEAVSLCERSCVQQPNFQFEEECLDSKLYYFNPELRTFNGAQADCSSFDSTGKLAVPTDLASAQRIETLFTQHKDELQNAFVGLRDFSEVGGANNTLRFLTVEGETNTFTSGAAGEAPWATSQPDDDDGSESCVGLKFDLSGLEDTSCDQLSVSVCELSCIEVTRSPTTSPTQAPTDSPTASPIANVGSCSTRKFGINNPIEVVVETE